MPNPIVVHADAELAIIRYLGSIPEVTALVPAARIATQLPNNPPYPFVLISRVAGQEIWPAFDEPVIAVNSYGASQQEANLVAQTIRGALNAIANDTVAGCVLVSAVEELGPQWLPDTVPTPPVPRYTARHRVLTHT